MATRVRMGGLREKRPHAEPLRPLPLMCGRTQRTRRPRIVTLNPCCSVKTPAHLSAMLLTWMILSVRRWTSSATMDEFAAEGYTHIECHCPHCRVTRLRPLRWLPRSRWASPSRSFQSACAVRSAAALCSRSSRGELLTCLASRLAVEGDYSPYNLDRRSWRLML
jgi:hypothetical protein